MKARKSTNLIRLKLICGVACLAYCGPWSQSAYAPPILDLGTLNGQASSEGFALTDTGRAAGNSGGKAFRTQGANWFIYDYPQSGDNVHNTLASYLPQPILISLVYDIWQASTNTPIELVGEYNNNALWRPYWYYEAPSGSPKYVRLLYDGTGAAYSVKPSVGGASAVVGFVIGSSGYQNAAYWSVTPTFHALYNYGDIYFPNEASVATDTDRNRTVGYRGAPHAFIVDSGVGGGAFSLSVPPGTTASVAYGIWTYGSTSFIVGFYVENGYRKPIRWSYTGNGQSTYTLLSLPSGHVEAVARSIYGYGYSQVIVGDGGPGQAACKWDWSGNATLLTYPDWILQRANKVNPNAAQGGGRTIVGIGQRNIGGTYYTRGFVY